MGGSIKKLREAVMSARLQGSVCPCCDQVSKAYKRKLCNTTLRALHEIGQELSKPGAPRHLHIGKFLTKIGSDAARGGDTARLVHWGLLERGEKAGCYRVTEDGYRFLRGELRIPQYKWFYNKRVAEDIVDSDVPLMAFGEIVK